MSIPTSLRYRIACLSALSLGCALLLTQCHPPGDGGQRQGDDSDTAGAFLKATFTRGWHEADLDQCPQVCRTAYRSTSDAFVDHFGLKNNAGGYDEILGSEVTFPWKDFSNNVTKKHPRSQPRAVVAHYGLDGSGNFVLGLSVVLVSPLPTGEWAYDTTKADFYIIEDHKMVAHSRSDWAPYHKNYWEKVYVEHTTAKGFEPVKKDYDHRYYVIPWDTELKFLGEHNQIDDATFVKFTNTAVEETDATLYDGCTGYQHTICVSIDGQLTDDDCPTGIIWRKRGANLGTPCPPRCGKFYFRYLSESCQRTDLCTPAIRHRRDTLVTKPAPSPSLVPSK